MALRTDERGVYRHDLWHILNIYWAYWILLTNIENLFANILPHFGHPPTFANIDWILPDLSQILGDFFPNVANFWRIDISIISSKSYSQFSLHFHILIFSACLTAEVCASDGRLLALNALISRTVRELMPGMGSGGVGWLQISDKFHRTSAE